MPQLDQLDAIDSRWRETGQLSRSDIAWLIAKAHEARADGKLMRVVAEVWPVAADETGLWLLNPTGPWPSEPLQEGSDPHAAATLELQQHGTWGDTVWLHQTSSRTDGGTQVETLLAIVRCPGLVRNTWPEALPITTDAAEVVGPPSSHSAIEPPAGVRFWDVLLHALRHLRYLADPALGNDATTWAALSHEWHLHLAAFEPAMAMMYAEEHQTA
jgi:hypothetical protein